MREHDVNMHTLPNDADQLHFRSFDSRTQTHSNNLCVDRLNFQFRSNIENQAQSQSQTRQTVVAKPDTYNWSSEIKALQLAASLRGSARSVLSVLTDLRPHQLEDYYELKFVFQTRFEPKNQTEMYRAKLNDRYRRRDESPSELAQI